MTQVRIRLNEAELLRAGFPRDAVVALRQIVAVIGSGLEIGEITDVEALVLTTNRNDGVMANAAQELQRLGEQINQIRRDSLSFQQGIQRELEALQHAIRRNDQRQEIDRLREQVGQIPKPNLSGIQAKLDEMELMQTISRRQIVPAPVVAASGGGFAVVNVDFGASFTDKAVTVVTGAPWVGTALVASVLTPAGTDPDELYLLGIEAVISDIIPGSGFTVTLNSRAEAKGVYQVMVVGG